MYFQLPVNEGALSLVLFYCCFGELSGLGSLGDGRGNPTEPPSEEAASMLGVLERSWVVLRVVYSNCLGSYIRVSGGNFPSRVLGGTSCNPEHDTPPY